MPNLNTLSEDIHQTCLALRPVPGHSPLIDAIARLGGPDFAARASRGGWYRPGRILDAGGGVVADDALAWLESAWHEAGEDVDRLLERFRACGHVVTRDVGLTHYLVAPYGDGATEFVQLEVEELQEVRSHTLSQITDAVESAEQLVEPPASARPSAHGPSRYGFRRVADMSERIGRIAATAAKPPAVLRFIEEWNASSAGRQRHFSDHWVLSLAEHLDRYRQPQTSATPFAAHPLRWSGADDTRGLELARTLHEYDRTSGYGFSWYFQMVSGYKVPRGLAPRVHADLAEGMAYLPERDAAIVERWVAEPYSA